jgi:hypothetical protein
MCPLYAVHETTHHIIFTYPATRFLWSFIAEALGPEWQALNLSEFLEKHAKLYRRRLFWLVFAAMTWSPGPY